jgi:hypothetical protein
MWIKCHKLDKGAIVFLLPKDPFCCSVEKKGRD